MSRTLTMVLRLAILFTCILCTYMKAIAQGANEVEFGYADKAANPISISAKTFGYVSVGIKLPPIQGGTLTGLRFYLGAKDLELTRSIFVSDVESQSILYTQKVDLQLGWNTIRFTTPFELTSDKGYFVGYQIQADDEVKLLGFDPANSGRAIGANYVQYGGGYYRVGDKTKLVEVSSEKVGNALIYASIEDRANSLDHVACLVYSDGFSRDELKPREANDLALRVRNIGKSEIRSLTFVARFGDIGGEQNVKLSALSLAPNVTQELHIGAKAPARGLGTATISILKVNDQEQILKDKSLSFPYRVYTPEGSWARKSFLVEKFTSEGCHNCPWADKPLEDLVKQMQEEGAEVSVIAHHPSFFKDPFSLSGSDNIAEFSYDRSYFTPALMIDRVSDDKEVGNLAGGFGYRVNKYSKAKEVPQVARITELSARDNGATLDIVISGETGYINADNVYLTVVLTEDHVQAVRQSGWNRPETYYHEHLPRAFATPGVGQQVQLRPDGSFSVELKGVAYSQDWNKANLKVVAFLHKKLDVWDYQERSVYAAKTRSWVNLTAVEEVNPSASLRIWIDRGYLQLNQEVDAIEIYDLTGRLIGRTNTQRLHTGLYIVRVLKDGKYHSQKVFVD